MIKIKIFLYFLITTFIILFYYSCSESPTNSGNDKSLTEISGKIESWTLGVQNLKAVVAYPSEPYSYVIDNTTINQDGSFKVTLKELSDIHLSPVDFSSGTECSGNIEFTQGTKWAGLYLEIYNSSDSSIGILYKSNYPDTACSGLIETDFVYMNYDSRITGTRTCKYSWGDTINSTYSFSGHKGWNTIYCRWDSYTPTNSKISYTEYYGIGSKWYCYSWGNTDANKMKTKLIHPFFYSNFKNY